MAVVVGLTPGAVQTIGGTGTTQKIFQSSIKNAAGVVQSPFVSGVTDFLLAIPGQNKLNGTRFNVLMSGNVYLHGTSPTWQLQLLGSVLGTSNTILAQTSAVSLTTANNYDWSLLASFIVSSTPSVSTLPGGSGILTGQFSSLINGTVGASATLTNNLTGVVMSGPTGGSPAAPTGGAAFYLKAAALFGVSDAANLASLTEFYAWIDS
jgi:hypothetical protein